MPLLLNNDTILAKVLKSPKGQRIAFLKLKQQVETAKTQLLQEFDTNPVTVELLQGPEQPYSEVLPNGYGNLFSFLGFSVGRKPTEPVRELLEKIYLIQKPAVDRKSFTFKIRLPSKEDLNDVSPMEWESGRSWIDAVTYGLGTFSHYMFSLTQGRFQNSKSNTAIQVGPDLRATSVYLTSQRYVIGMLGDFKRKFKKE